MTTSPADTDQTIVLVDDHAVVRAGLRRLLEDAEGVTVVGEAGNGRDALEVVEVKRPSVVLLDLDLPDTSGIDLLPEIQRVSRGASQTLILSMHDEAKYVERAFAAGADGYLLKDAAESELVAALATLRAGERYVFPPLGAMLARAAMAGPSDPLTERERDITRLLALGHTNQEIASQLYLSVRTIETHRAHIMSKLSLNSRADLTKWALKNDLLDAE